MSRSIALIFFSFFFFIHRQTLAAQGLVQSTQDSIPLLHVVEKGETLYRISQKYRVAVSLIQDWNQLHGTLLHPAQRLIVGYSLQHTPLAVRDTFSGKPNVKSATGVTKAGHDKPAIVRTLLARVDEALFQPARFHAVCEGISPGTIVKVQNKNNGKVVFVKIVPGTLPESDATDKMIVLSRPSAEKIGVIGNDRVNVQISFFAD